MEIRTDPSAGAMKDIPIAKNLHKLQVVTLLPHKALKYKKTLRGDKNMQSAQNEPIKIKIKKCLA